MLLLGVVQAQKDGVVPLVTSFDLLEQRVLDTAEASVTFSSLSIYAADYQHLQLRIVGRTTTNNAFPGIQFNGDTGANYVSHDLSGNGSSVTSGAELNRTNAVLGPLEGTTSPTGAFGAIVTDILDAFNTSKFKTVRALGGRTGVQLIRLHSGLYRNTAAVSSITIVNNFGDSFITGSRFSLYGIKAV